MKKIIVIFISICYGFFGITQSRKADISPSQRKIEIGVNATHFLSNIFSLSNEKVSTKYAFTSKLLHNKVLGTRLSLGGNFDQKRQDFGSTSFDLGYDLRLGLEYSKSLSSKFYILFGLDVFGEYKKNETNSFIDTDKIFVKTKFTSLGFGPALRIEYTLTDRIVLMTESFLYGSFYKRERNENGRQKIENGTRMFLSEPTSLFISYKF